MKHKKYIILFMLLPFISFSQGKGAITTNTEPTANQVLIYNGTEWVPKYTDTLTVVSDGQSNSVGQGVPSGSFTFKANLKVWNNTAWVAPVLGQAPFNPSGANNAALQFCEKLARENPTTLVRLIQTGNSGQPISYWINAPQTGYTTTNSAVLAALGATGKVDVLVWIQGESDYLRTPAQYTTDFYTLRSLWISAGWLTPATKHLLGGLYIGSGSTLGFQDATLRAIGLDSIVQTGYANPFGLTTYDNLHWDSPSLTKYGQEVLYNAYRATPHPYTSGTSGIEGTISNNVLAKGTTTNGIQNSRLTDVSTLLTISDPLTNTLHIVSDAAPTQGQGNAKIKFSQRWASSIAAGGDDFGTGEMRMVKSTVVNNGGTDFEFWTSGFGAGGLAKRGAFTYDGAVDAVAGFRQGGTAANGTVLIGDGSVFKGLTPTVTQINAWGGVSRDNLGVDNGVLLKSPTVVNGATTDTTLTMIPGVLPLLRMRGGIGTGQGPVIQMFKGGNLAMAFGVKSAFDNSNSNNGVINITNGDFDFLGPAGDMVTVTADKNLIIHGQAGAGVHLATLNTNGKLERSTIDPANLAVNLDQAYNNFGATASKVVVDAAEGQTGGLTFDHFGANNYTINLKGTGDFQIRDSINATTNLAVLRVFDNGYTSIGTQPPTTDQRLLVTENGTGLKAPVRITNATEPVDGDGVFFPMGVGSQDKFEISTYNPVGAVEEETTISSYTGSTKIPSLILTPAIAETRFENAVAYEVFNATATTVQLDGRTSYVDVPSTGTTTTMTLPEIVAGLPGTNQVRVGYVLHLSVERAVAVTISRFGSDDLIYVDGVAGSSTSISTTGGTFFAKKIVAISANKWAIYQ
jgi:hypothetical protein